MEYDWKNDCARYGRAHVLHDEWYTIANGSKQLCPTCSECGWKGQPVKQPHNVGKKTRTVGTDNRKHADYWRDKLGGELRCFWCQGTEGDVLWYGSEMHHGWPVHDGGPDESWNVIPLCAFCHSAQQTAARNRRLMVSMISRQEDAP